MAESSKPLSHHISPYMPRRNFLNGPLLPSPIIPRRNVNKTQNMERSSKISVAPELPRRPMSTAKKAVLRKNSIMLKNDLEFDDCMILHFLYQDKVLSDENLETLKKLKNQPRADQVHKFLKLIEKKGDAAFDSFLQALREEQCYEHILEKLEESLARELSQEERKCGFTRQDSCVYRTPSITRCNDNTPIYTEEENSTYIVKTSTFASIVSPERKEDLTYRLNEVCDIVLESEYEELPGSNSFYQQIPINNCAVTVPGKTYTVPEVIQEYLESEKELVVDSQLILCKDLSELIWEITKDTSRSFAYDSQGNLLLVCMNTLKRQGNAIGEKWYYPIPVSSHQIGIWLSQTKLKGCFYVYTSTNAYNEGKNNFAPFNLSLCHNENGDVLHHRIEQNGNNELIIRGPKGSQGMKFQNIHVLVEYFKLNRGFLPCRIRWSPSELETKPQFESKIPQEEIEIFRNEELHDKLINHTSLVYKGRYGNKDVAIKMPAKSPLNRIDEDDFLSEAKILQTLQHPNICKLEGVCYTDKYISIVLQYAAQSSLKQCLSVGSISIDPGSVLRMWIQVLNALDYLEKQNFIIHRDVAARNCLVLGSGLQVQLSDFGMAVKVIQYDEFLGDSDDMFAVRWAAPEVLKESRFSTKSDIWAAGVLFWEIASGGALPYTNIQHGDVCERILGGKVELRYEDSMDSGFKLIIKELVSLCWKKNLDERPAAEYLITLCNRYLDSIDGTETIYDNGKSFCNSQIRKSGKGRRSLRALKDFFLKK